MFSLRFDKSSILEWSRRYPQDYDAEVETRIAPSVRGRGYFLKHELRTISRWKSPRSKALIESNADDYIETVTRAALSTPNERLRIEVLTLLNGVGWPTASVVLHFAHSEPYPILDFRALWSLGVDAATIVYDFEFWGAYTQFCRQLARETNVTMRTLDRALWQYSETNQKPDVSR